MREIYLHIGYAKCATTFLQRHFFPVIGGVNYIGRHYDHEGKEIDGKRFDWIYDLALKDQFDPAKAQKFLLGNSSVKSKNLVSHEIFLRPYRWERALERMKSIAEGFDKLKLIVSIRNQTDLILSRYIHDIQISHFDGKLEDSIDFDGKTTCRWPVCSQYKSKVAGTLVNYFPVFGNCPCRKKGVKSIKLQYYNYLELYRKMQQHIDKSDIHFIITENLRKNPVEELNRLNNFLGEAPLKEEELKKISKREANVTKEVKVDRKALKEKEVMKAATSYFIKSNEEFSKQTGLNIKDFGYY